MEDPITLKLLALLICCFLLIMSFLWGILYIVLIKKFNIIFTTLNIVAKGISEQHNDIYDSLTPMHKCITKQLSILEKLKKE